MVTRLADPGQAFKASSMAGRFFDCVSTVTSWNRAICQAHCQPGLPVPNLCVVLQAKAESKTRIRRDIEDIMRTSRAHSNSSERIAEIPERLLNDSEAYLPWNIQVAKRRSP